MSDRPVIDYRDAEKDDPEAVLIPVAGSPVEAPFIYVDNLYAVHRMGDTVRLQYVLNQVVPGETKRVAEGRYAATICMTLERFQNMVAYLNSIAGDFSSDRDTDGE